MKNLWTYIEKKKWHADTKYRVALLILGTLFALAGLALWLIIRICFIGYPVVISWFVVLLYSCNHDFHDGKRCR